MKHLSLTLAALCLCASGCREGSSTANVAGAQANATNAATSSAEKVVAGFADPDLAGMTVRDHRQGAQVVSPPHARSERMRRIPLPGDPPDILRSFAPRAVLTAVNDTTIRNAAHFRDLMNDAHTKGEEVRLSQLMFFEDSDNDGWSTTSLSEPENQINSNAETPAKVAGN